MVGFLVAHMTVVLLAELAPRSADLGTLWVGQQVLENGDSILVFGAHRSRQARLQDFLARIVIPVRAVAALILSHESTLPRPRENGGPTTRCAGPGRRSP